MSGTAMALNVKLRWFLDQACYWAEKILTDVNLDLLMPGKDKNFCDSLVLDFGICWHQVKTIYCHFVYPATNFLFRNLYCKFYHREKNKLLVTEHQGLIQKDLSNNSARNIKE